MATRTVTSFVQELPSPRVHRIAVHVGEQRAPSLAGEVLADDYRVDGGALDVPRMVARIEAIAANAGWPDQSPSMSARAYAEGETKRALDTYQKTVDGWTEPGPGRPDRSDKDTAFVKMVDGLLAMAAIIKDSNKDLTAALTAERNYATERSREASEMGRENVELAAANGMLEGAVENHQKSDELEVKLRGFDLAEKAMENAMASRMSPTNLKKWAAENPDKFKALKADIRNDPELLAALLG